MAQDLAALDTALTSLGAELTQLAAEIPVLIAKVQAAPTADYTNEVTAIQAMIASATTAVTSAKTVTGQ